VWSQSRARFGVETERREATRVRQMRFAVPGRAGLLASALEEAPRFLGVAAAFRMFGELEREARPRRTSGAGIVARAFRGSRCALG
jgi:hypothetical protein